MAQRNISFIEGEFYHLYNRGNSKQLIFLDDQDRDRFTKYLYLCNSKKNISFRDDIKGGKIDAWDFEKGEPIISIGAWVLMPNHFHLFVTIPLNLKTPQPGCGEENEVSLFMRKLCGAYTRYFNKKYQRTGGLFESKFKAKVAVSDEYTKYIFSYIHLNPIKLIDREWKEKGIQNIEEAKNFLETYQWSSYCDFLNHNRKQKKILTTKDFPGYFTRPEIFEKEIFDWLAFEPLNLVEGKLSNSDLL